MPLRVVAGPGAQAGRPFKLVKSTQTGKTAAETAQTTVHVIESILWGEVGSYEFFE